MIAVGGNITLQLGNAILGRAKLLREPLGRIQNLSPVLIGRVGGPL
jgi:hypothetical protein